MKTNIQIDLQPFSVPGLVHEKFQAPSPAPAAPVGVPAYPNEYTATNQPGIRSSLTLSLSDIPAETLDKMCDEFRDAVFKKAGKRRPEKY